MALEFQPPPAWLLQEYMQRKQPAEIANEGIGNAINTYAQAKKQQQAQALAQEDRDIKLAGLAGDSGTQGLELLNAQRKARGLPPISMPATGAPVQAPQQPQTPFPQGSPSMNEPFPQGGGESPIIAHWNLLMPQFQPSTGTPAGSQPPIPGGKPTAPDLGSDPALVEFNQIGSQAYQQKYGTKGLAKVKTALEIQKGLQEKKPKGNTPYYDAKGNKQFELPPEAKIIPGSTTADNRTFIGNDSEGNPLFADRGGSISAGNVPSGGPVLPKSSTMPTSVTRASAEFANTIIPHIQDMRDLVKQADSKGYIGPAAGRVFNQFMAGKIGSTGNADADKLLGQLRATDSLLKTGAMRVHFGARGGQQMYDHFSELLNSGKQSAAMLNGSLDTLQSFMEGYSNAGKVGGGHDKPATEDGYRYTPGPGGKGNKANWKKVS